MKKRLLSFLFPVACGPAFSQVPQPPVPNEPVKVETKEEIIYDLVDEPAGFPGGETALKAYIKKNLVYPESAKKLGREGSCFLQFVVSKNGYISHVKVKKGVLDCPECDQEVVRLVKGMPKWIPGKINGEPVNSIFNLPVMFRP